MNETRPGQKNDPIQVAEAYLSVADRVLQALREKITDSSLVPFINSP